MEVAVGVVLLAIAVVDARERIIPNVLVAALVAIWAARAVQAAWAGSAGGLLASSAEGLAAVVATLALLAALARALRLRDGIGGGDVKLFCALGLCLGATRALAVILVACLVGLAGAQTPRHRAASPGTFAFGPPVFLSYCLVSVVTACGLG